MVTTEGASSSWETGRSQHIPLQTSPSSLYYSLSEQMTPAVKRVPVLLQVTWVLWWGHWFRDSSDPVQRTPLITTSVTFPESQYQVSWGCRKVFQ